MLVLLWFLIAPVALAAMVYAGVAVYRKYKDNQLEIVSPIIDEAEDLIDKDWVNLVPEKPLEVRDVAAVKQFNDFLKEEQRKYPLFEYSIYDNKGDFTQLVWAPGMRLSIEDDRKSYNDACARLKEWLVGKQVKTYSGNQNIDIMKRYPNKLSNLERDLEEKKRKEELRINPSTQFSAHGFTPRGYKPCTRDPNHSGPCAYPPRSYQERVRSPHALSMPNNLSAQTAGDAMRDITEFLNDPINKQKSVVGVSDVLENNVQTPTAYDIVRNILIE